MLKKSFSFKRALPAALIGSLFHIFDPMLSSSISTSEIWALAADLSGPRRLHNSNVLYQSALYFCDEHQGKISLFIRSDLGNVPAIVFTEENRLDERTLSQECKSLAMQLCVLTEKKAVRFLTWWDTPDGDYEIKISESEGYAIRSDKHYLFTLKKQNDPGRAIDALRGIASLYGGEAVIN